MRGEILSKSVVSRRPGDPYLTISQIPTIFPKMAQLAPSPSPYRSGLVVRPPAWNPRTPGVPGSIPRVCSKLGLSGVAQKLSPRDK